MLNLQTPGALYLYYNNKNIIIIIIYRYVYNISNITKAGPNYSNIRILVRKISIRSLNQYSELFFRVRDVTRAREANYKRHQAEKRERWRKNRYLVSLYFTTQH